MKHARTDYDRIQDPDGKIPDDEPVFLIRGQDPAGAFAVRQYARQALDLGVDVDVVKAINLHADKMARYSEQAGHGPADVPSKGVLRGVYSED